MTRKSVFETMMAFNIGYAWAEFHGVPSSPFDAVGRFVFTTVFGWLIVYPGTALVARISSYRIRIVRLDR